MMYKTHVKPVSHRFLNLQHALIVVIWQSVLMFVLSSSRVLDHRHDRIMSADLSKLHKTSKKKVVLGCSGSVASIKVPGLACLLQSADVSLCTCMKDRKCLMSFSCKITASEMNLGIFSCLLIASIFPHAPSI